MNKMNIFEVCDIESANGKVIDRKESSGIPMLIGYGWDHCGDITLLVIEAKLHYIDSENTIMYLELNQGLHHGYDTKGIPVYKDTKAIDYFDYSEEGYEKASAELFKYLSTPDSISYSRLTFEQRKIKRPELSEDDYLFLLGLSDKFEEIIDRTENDESFAKTVKNLNIDFDIHEMWQAIYDNIHDIPF